MTPALLEALLSMTSLLMAPVLGAPIHDMPVQLDLSFSELQREARLAVAAQQMASKRGLQAHLHQHVSESMDTWGGSPHFEHQLPAHFLAVDHGQRLVRMVIRGCAFSPTDWTGWGTAIKCVPTSLPGLQGYVHPGIFASAKGLLEYHKNTLPSVLRQHPGCAIAVNCAWYRLPGLPQLLVPVVAQS